MKNLNEAQKSQLQGFYSWLMDEFDEKPPAHIPMQLLKELAQSGDRNVVLIPESSRNDLQVIDREIERLRQEKETYLNAVSKLLGVDANTYNYDGNNYRFITKNQTNGTAISN